MAHSVLFESYDAIKVLPGSLAARRQLAGEAQKYLDSLARENTSDRPLVLDLAESYRRLGDVRGAPYAANLGDAPGAIESIVKLTTCSIGGCAITPATPRWSWNSPAST